MTAEPDTVEALEQARTHPEVFVVLMSLMYLEGAFPMADGRGRIAFYTSDPRGLLPLNERDGFRIPRSVSRDIRSGRFAITADTAFERVIRGCALPRRPSPSSQADGTWISDQLVGWYTTLHAQRCAHSVEAWCPDPLTGTPELVGGVYGVSFGRAFFAESMFHRPRPRMHDGSRDPLDGSGASSVCLVALVRHLDRCGYDFCDIQVITPHVARFGAEPIGADEYLPRLRSAMERLGPSRFNRVPFAPFPDAGAGGDD